MAVAVVVAVVVVVLVLVVIVIYVVVGVAVLTLDRCTIHPFSNEVYSRQTEAACRPIINHNPRLNRAHIPTGEAAVSQSIRDTNDAEGAVKAIFTCTRELAEALLLLSSAQRPKG